MADTSIPAGTGTGVFPRRTAPHAGMPPRIPAPRRRAMAAVLAAGVLGVGCGVPSATERAEPVPVTRPAGVTYPSRCDTALAVVRETMGSHGRAPLDADIRAELRAAVQDSYRVCAYRDYTRFQAEELLPWARALPEG